MSKPIGQFLLRCWHAALALGALALIALWLAWIYVRHGEDAFYEQLGQMICDESH